MYFVIQFGWSVSDVCEIEETVLAKAVKLQFCLNPLAGLGYNIKTKLLKMIVYKELRGGNYDAEAFTPVARVEDDEDDEAEGGFFGLLRPHFTEAI